MMIWIKKNQLRQAKLIQQEHASCIFSKVLNEILRNHVKDFRDQLSKK